MNHMSEEEKMELLLQTCKDYPEIYNKIGNLLFHNFEIQEAEICLLCTYCVIAYEKAREEG